MKKLIKKIGIISATTIATLGSTIGFATTAHAKVNPDYALKEENQYGIRDMVFLDDYYVYPSLNPNCPSVLGSSYQWTEKEHTNADKITDTLHTEVTYGNYKNIYNYHKQHFGDEIYGVYALQITRNMNRSPDKNKQIKSDYTLKKYGKNYTKIPMSIYNMPTKKYIDDFVYKSSKLYPYIDGGYEVSYKGCAQYLKNAYSLRKCPETIDYIFNTGDYDPVTGTKTGWKIGADSYFEKNTSKTIYKYEPPSNPNF